MPMGFTTAEFLGGMNPENQAVAVEQVESARAQNDLWDKIVDTAKQIVPKALSSAQAAIAQLSYSGSTGNFLSTDEDITLTGKFFRAAEQTPEKIGSPLYATVRLDTLNGFIKCRNPVFSGMVNTVVEENAIEQFMSDGFYFE